MQIEVKEGKKSVTSKTRGKQTEREKASAVPLSTQRPLRQSKGEKKNAGAREKHFQFF